MINADDQLYEELFRFIMSQGELNDSEVMNLALSGYTNYNKLKGNKRLKCLFPKCNNVGVQKSHLFAESFLDHFTIAGELYTKSFYPKRDLNPNYTIESVGKNIALTFPGFCSACEQKFLFEKRKDITSSEDCFLQLFRTVCYEKRILEREISDNSRLLRVIGENGIKKMQPYLNSGAVFKSFKGAHKIEGVIEKRSKKLQQDLVGIDKKYWFLAELLDNDLPATIFMVDIDRYFPFFTGYIGNMRFKQPSGVEESDIVVNIHPVNRIKTKILLLDFSNQIDRDFFDKFQASDWIGLFAEIIACSNNWLVNKGYWDCHVAENIQKFILKNRRVVSKN